MAGRFGLSHEEAERRLYGNCETGDFPAWSRVERAGELQPSKEVLA